MADQLMAIGESFLGEGVDVAHVNVVFGPRSGPAVADVLAARDSARNPFYDPERSSDPELA
jgi:formaldehyde-activating enzyme involved in methanogenesis